MTEARQCPACGEPSEPGQLVCLHCGGRLALSPPRPDRRGTLALALGLVALGGIACGFALGALAADDDGEQAARLAAQRRAVKLEQRHATARREQAAERRRQRERARREATSGTWPANLEAYTVVLVTSGDEQSARETADEAAATGIEAGVLRSDDFQLGQGFWIVYSGTFEDQAAAAERATTLAERYPGAYPQLIDGG